jgi:hypothetical protein
MTRLAPAASGPRKNPLRTAIAGGSGMPPATSLPPAGPTGSGPGQRRVMISEYCAWLRSRTSKQKRSFQEETITAYKVAARALDAWMTEEGIQDDFTGCDTRLLNRFFRAYAASHGHVGSQHADCGQRWLVPERRNP